MKQDVKRVRGIFRCAAAAALCLFSLSQSANAKSREARDADELSRPTGPPVLAVVALGEQHVTIYDAEGRILRAPVSTGQTGYETPAGIYSVLEKNREHYSNLYDDASMPFMQRITWSGIALHAGQLPGHPASHGCIRLPSGFAERLFGMTKLGMRVVIVREDMRPISFVHPALFKPGPIVSDVATGEAAGQQPAANAEPIAMHLGASSADASVAKPKTWRSVAAAKKAEADAAGKTAEDARRAVLAANAELARSAKTFRMVEFAKKKAEDEFKDIEEALSSEAERLSDEHKARLEEEKVKAEARLKEAQSRLDAAQAEGTARMAAAAAARDAVKAAVEAKELALKDARLAQAKTAPVSVFISRKTQRLYVRQAFQPMFDSEVTIRDPQAAIGTHIYTALDYVDDGADLRWTALAMYADPTDPGPAPSRHGSRRGGEGRATDAKPARSALERISIPEATLARIREVVSPGSALIISDEALSNETGKATDFVVVMSGEPQGGIKIRKRNNEAPSAWRRDPYGDYGYRRPYYQRSPSFSGGGGLFGWW